MDEKPPLPQRPIRPANLVRGLVALLAVVAIGGALIERRLDLALVGVVLLVGLPMVPWLERLRSSLAESLSTKKQP